MSDKKECSVLFLDVRNFTNLMSKYSDNSTFHALISKVYEYGLKFAGAFCNTEDFYINSTGDGFLCIIFGETHYIKAYLVGLLLVKYIIKDFESFFEFANENKPLNGMYYYGIGIESGYVYEVKAKNEGKEVKTYLGNVINEAARIESLSKEHGRAPLLYGKELNNLIADNVFNVKYNELIKDAKDNPNQCTVDEEYNAMLRVNEIMLSSYIFEHKLKGVDEPRPIYRLSPTLYRNMKIEDWKFLKLIPKEISDKFALLY